jgi:hypothetical protein
MRNRGYRLILALIVAAIAFPTEAEVLFLKDGSVILGSIVGPADGGVSYESFGRSIVVDVGQVAESDKDLAKLSALDTEIRLMDGSIIKGKVVDFDPEIGLFVDIAFGVLTVPNTAVSSIVDPIKRTRYTGARTLLRAGAGAYTPLFGSLDDFGPSWIASAGFEWALPFARGLYGGLGLSFIPADYSAASDVKYAVYYAAPELTYRFLSLRSRPGFLGSLTPYVSANLGPAYIAVSDPSMDPRDYGSPTLGIGLDCGTEIAAGKRASIRVGAFSTMLMQKGSPFIAAGATLSVVYEP